jgi:SAC3 family protein LENG8/THP3
MKAPNPPQPASQPQAGPRQWSPSVRQYVQRAFAENNSVSGVTKSEMEAKLKEIISTAAAHHTLDTVDWDKFPLPQQIVLQERKAAITAPVSNYHIQVTNSLSNSNNSRKRKSSELGPDTANHEDHSTMEANTPPWRAKNSLSRAEKKAAAHERRFRIDGGISSYNSPDANLESRKRRFESKDTGFFSPRQSRFTTHDESPTMDVDNGPVVGRSTALEKRYFRLTSDPNPDDVRPLHILEQTLDLLKKKWKKESNYSYICDQFKSLRQDLTVQHIKTEFTVTVYEIHARIALEKGDLGEYNQCQTQLSALYAQNLGGHPMEFKAYRILYFLYTCNRSSMNSVLADLTKTEKDRSEVKHALAARSALALGNFHRFFKLYHETPNMGAYLMDMFVDRERLVALANICKA